MGDAVDTQHAAAHDDDSTRGRPYHDKITQDLKAMLNKRRILDRQVVRLPSAPPPLLFPIHPPLTR
jgi:hypothetical protein